jgi:hypothetical protein
MEAYIGAQNKSRTARERGRATRTPPAVPDAAEFITFPLLSFNLGRRGILAKIPSNGIFTRPDR